MLAITKYADRLLDGLPALEWDAGIKALQCGWIGRSEVLTNQTMNSWEDSKEYSLAVPFR